MCFSLFTLRYTKSDTSYIYTYTVIILYLYIILQVHLNYTLYLTGLKNIHKEFLKVLLTRCF